MIAIALNELRGKWDLHIILGSWDAKSRLWQAMFALLIVAL